MRLDIVVKKNLAEVGVARPDAPPLNFEPVMVNESEDIFGVVLKIVVARTREQRTASSNVTSDGARPVARSGLLGIPLSDSSVWICRKTRDKLKRMRLEGIRHEHASHAGPELVQTSAGQTYRVLPY